MIALKCPGCGTALSIPPQLAGKRCRCPKCNHISEVPAPVSSPSTGATDPAPARRDTATLLTTPAPALPDTLVSGNQPADVTPPSSTLGRHGDDGPPPLPRDIPGYEVLGELGRGGMGVVYKAHQKSLKRLVALKMILGGACADRQAFARFQAEAEALARLHHPHIVQIHEVGEYQGQPYFSLEFLDGGSLAGKLGGNPLPVREAAELTEKLARAVQAAHESGIAHRDLKPANVLLSSDGEPKITDFGLAKQLDLDAGQTRTGAVVGTPRYMAPEQARGETRLVGPAADVYSLGVMLYEFLTGSTPFKGATPVETLMQVVSDEPVPPSRLQPKVPQDLETICLKCLQKEIGKRYHSAGALADDVRRYLDGLPIEARPIGTWERAGKWARRRPALAALVAVCVLATLALLAGSLYFTNELRGERNTAVDERIEADNQRKRAEEEEEKTRKEKERAEGEWARAEREKARAKDKENEARTQLENARQALISAHLARASILWQTDPGLGLSLLRNRRDCPFPARDFAWHYYDRLCLADRGVLPLGRTQVNYIAVSPDGKRVAASGADFAIRIWEFPSGKLLHECKGHSDKLSDIVFSPDSKTLYSGGGKDRTIRQWDVDTGKEVRIVQTMPGWVGGLAIHPKGKWLAASGYVDGKPNKNAPSDIYHQGRVVMLNLETGETKTFMQNHPSGIFSVTFNHDGSLLACGTTQTARIKIWETDTGKEQADLVAMLDNGMVSWVHRVAFSHDGKYLAHGSADRMIHVWDVKEKKQLIKPFIGHLNDVHTVLFSRDDRQLLSVGLDGSVKLWDIASHKEILTLRDCSVGPLAFSPDGLGILCEKGLDLVHVAIPQQPEFLTLSDHRNGILQVAFSPDGKHLASASRDGTARLWNPETGKGLVMAGNHLGPMTSVAFSADSQTVFLSLAGSRTAKPHDIGRWDVRTGKRLEPLGGHETQITSLAASPRHPWLASGSKDGVVKGWDLVNNKEAFSLAHPDQPIRALGFHQTEKLLAGHVGTSFILWSLEHSPPKVIRRREVGEEFAFAFSLDGKTLAEQKKRNVELVDPVDGTIQRLIGPASHDIHAITFCPDRTTLALGLHDRTVQLWNIPFNQLRGTLGGHQAAVSGVAFDPAGQLLASCSSDLVVSRPGSSTSSTALYGPGWALLGEIKIWSALHTRAIGHAERPTRVTLSGDGRRACSFAGDQSVLAWDTTSGKEVAGWASVTEADVLPITQHLTPDGSKLLSLFQDGTLAAVDCATGHERARLRTEQSLVPRLYFSEDGKNVHLASTTDNAVHVIDMDTLKVMRKLSVPGTVKRAPSDLSSDLHWLVQSESRSSVVEVFDLQKATRIELKGVGQEVKFIKCLPGNQVMTFGKDGTGMLWDLTTGSSNKRFEAPTERVRSLSLSLSCGLLAVATPRDDPRTTREARMEVRVWDIATFKEQRPRLIPWEGYFDMAILPQGELLIAQTHGTGVKFLPRIKLLEK